MKKIDFWERLRHVWWESVYLINVNKEGVSGQRGVSYKFDQGPAVWRRSFPQCITQGQFHLPSRLFCYPLIDPMCHFDLANWLIYNISCGNNSKILKAYIHLLPQGSSNPLYVSFSLLPIVYLSWAIIVFQRKLYFIRRIKGI